MGALLRKEWYVMGRTVVQITALWVVVAALFAWIGDKRAAWLYCCNVPIFSISFSLNSLDVDARCRWDDWLAVTPMEPWKIVLSKYAFTGEVLLLLSVCGVLAGRLTASMELEAVLVWPAAVLTVLMTGTNFPLVYRLGRLKGTLLSVAVWLSLLLLATIYLSLAVVVTGNWFFHLLGQLLRLEDLVERFGTWQWVKYLDCRVPLAVRAVL